MLYLYHFHHFPPQAPLMFLPTFIISSLLLLHAYTCVHMHLHICTHVYTTESVCHCLYVHVSRVDHVDLGNSSGNLYLDHTDCPSLSSYWPLAALYMGTGPCSVFLVYQLAVSLCWPCSGNHVIGISWVYFPCCAEGTLSITVSSRDFWLLESFQPSSTVAPEPQAYTVFDLG